MGTFPAGNPKGDQEWQNAIPLLVYPFWSWCSTGRVVLSSIFITPFAESRHWTEQSIPLGMCPCGTESQVGKRYQTKGHKLGATDVLSVANTVPKNNCAQSLTHVWLYETPWTVAHHALSLEFPKQKSRSGLLFPSLQAYRMFKGSGTILYDVMANTWHYIFVKMLRTLQHKKWISVYMF